MSTIKFERDETSPKTRRNWHVLIDGEHRATFVWRTSYYTLEGADGEDIKSVKRGSMRRWAFNKSEFDEATRAALDLGYIPTRAWIELAALIDRAHKENRERDSAISARRLKVRRDVLCAALARYINDDGGDAEHMATARRLLAEHDGSAYAAWARTVN